MRRRRTVRSIPALVIAGVLAVLIPLISGSREGALQKDSAEVSSLPFASPPHAPAISAGRVEGLSGKVIRVLDGDTIEILKIEGAARRPVRIRMTGIDAPEKSQPFGEKCRENLASLVAGKEVRIDARGTDRYSRQLGVILVPAPSASPTPHPSEIDANLAQISAGCAWHYKQYEKQQKPAEREAYAAAEVSARAAKLGLWRDAEPQAPWEFRREGRGARRKGRSR